MSRWGSQSGLIGARITTPEERAKGAPAIVWDTERVFGVSEDFARRYQRELSQAIAMGDLRERSLQDFEAYERRRLQEREERRKRAEDAAKGAKEKDGAAPDEDVGEQAVEAAGEPTEGATSDAAEEAPEASVEEQSGDPEEPAARKGRR